MERSSRSCSAADLMPADARVGASGRTPARLARRPRSMPRTARGGSSRCGAASMPGRVYRVDGWRPVAVYEQRAVRRRRVHPLAGARPGPGRAARPQADDRGGRGGVPPQRGTGCSRRGVRRERADDLPRARACSGRGCCTCVALGPWGVLVGVAVLVALVVLRRSGRAWCGVAGAALVGSQVRTVREVLLEWTHRSGSELRIGTCASWMSTPLCPADEGMLPSRTRSRD